MPNSVSDTTTSLSEGLYRKSSGKAVITPKINNVNAEQLIEQALLQPKEDIKSIETRISDTAVRLSQWEALEEKLNNLKSYADMLGRQGSYHSVKNDIYTGNAIHLATSNGEAVNKYITAQRTGDPATGQYNLTVQQQAEFGEVQSSFSSLFSTASFAERTTELSSLGVSSGDVLTINGTNITLQESWTLDKLVETINTHTEHTHVRSFAYYDGANYQLALGTTQSGEVISFENSTSGVVDNLGLNDASFGTSFTDLDTQTLADFGIQDNETFSIPYQNGEDSVVITVQSTDTLSVLINKINTHKNLTGVTASYLQASEDSHLLKLSTSNLGEKIALTDTDGIFKNIGLPTEKDAQIASFSIDGFQYTSPNNSINVINGMEFSIQFADPDTSININIAPNVDAFSLTIQEYVKSYNAFVDEVNWQLGIHEDEKRTDKPMLARDFTFMSLYTSIRDNMRQVKQEGTPGYTSLSSIGVSEDRDISHSGLDKIEIMQQELFNKRVTNTSINDLINLFANTLSTSNTKFSVNSGPKNLTQLNGKDINVTLTYDGDEYKATLTQGSFSEEVVVDPIKKIIKANKDGHFAGIQITYNADIVADVTTEDSVETTVVYRRGIANALSDQIASATRYKNQKPGTIENIKASTKRTEKDLERTKVEAQAALEKREQHVLDLLGRLSSLQQKLEQTEQRMKMLMAYMS